MDGVIVDSNPFHKTALKQFCSAHGHELTEKELQEKIYGRRNQDWLLNVFGHLEPENMKRYADEKESLFRTVYDKAIKPVDGLATFLKKLSDLKVPVAIATSAPRANVDFTLLKTGLGHYFKTILDDTHVSKGKPDPEVYLKTAKALNYKPQDCVVFEDSLAGVEAAKKAGCKVVGITTTHSRKELDQTDLVIENFEGLDPRGLISRLFPD